MNIAAARTSGHIGFQAHCAPVEFRNVRIRVVAASQAVAARGRVVE